MTNKQIEIRLGELVKEEKRLATEIVLLIQEANTRRLHLERGYPSLFEWLTKEYGYSEGAANRRIQAARILSEVPEPAQKLETGELNLSTLCQVQTAIRREEKRQGTKIPKDKKRELIAKIENQSMTKTEQLIATTFPEQAQPEKLRAINEQELELKITIDQETLKLLKHFQCQISHKQPEATYAEAIKEALKVATQNADQARRRVKEHKQPNQSERTKPADENDSLAKAVPEVRHGFGIRGPFARAELNH